MANHRISSGVLVYREGETGIEVLLAHPGGPFFVNKDEGAWSIPKGEPEPGEDLETCARRELKEETGIDFSGDLVPLGAIRQAGGKVVHCFAARIERIEARIGASEVDMEWPPRSGTRVRFPEIDRLELFPLPAAKTKINKAQVALLDRLSERLA